VKPYAIPKALARGVRIVDVHSGHRTTALLLLVGLALATVPFAPLARAQTVVKPLDADEGTLVPQNVYASLYQASEAPYGASGLAYLGGVHNLTASAYSSNGKPILVYAGAEYCMYCAVQRWPLIMALMRFGNFTGLEYMTSSVSDGDYATFTFVASTYQSKYVVFQPYEAFDRAGTPLETIPTNYTSSFQQYGMSAFPFLNFADEYYISGSLLNPSILGTQNWTQIISSIKAGDAVGSQIRQAANAITAVICKTTGNEPTSVCNQDSITALTDSLASYTPPKTSESTVSPTVSMNRTTTTTPTSSTTSSGNISEFPVLLGFALVVTVAIVVAYVVTRRVTLPRTGSMSGASRT